MPRGTRRYTETGYYHIVLKGSGGQILFEDDSDRSVFLRYLEDMFSRYNLDLIAWCLMSNHAHLLVSDAEEKVSQAIHDLATAYAVYFNKERGHSGAVFDGRFHSVPIESDEQLLCAVRYIHDNPAKACISSREDYPWSSYRAYSRGCSSFTNIKPVCFLIQGQHNFEKFSYESKYAGYSFRETTRISDEEALDMAKQAVGIDPLGLKAMPVEMRNRGLQMLRDAGMSVRQLERLTGIGRSTIARNTHP